MKLHFIQVCPDDNYFISQLYVQLNNFREMGYADRARVLFFLPKDRMKKGWNPKAKEIVKVFPEVKFFFYEDKADVHRLIQVFNYVPLLRPYCLKKHFDAFPELKEDAVFYHDSDVVFTKHLDFQPFLEENTCYLSDTYSYISAEYFDSKVKDVKPEYLEDYKKRDILHETAQLAGVTRKICEDNSKGSGGAQYLLKGEALTHNFWDAVLSSTMNIRLHLRSVNGKFFQSEDKGFQSWCADMWAVLWNLWRLEIKTACPKEFDFAWPHDPISKWQEVYLYHDAGGGGDTYNKKGKNNVYVNNYEWPFDEDFSYINRDKCSFNYVREIIKTKNNLNPKL